MPPTAPGANRQLDIRLIQALFDWYALLCTHYGDTHGDDDRHQQTLRLEPDGVKTEFIVVSGTQVDILDTKGDWSKVRPVLPMPVKDRPTGWVVSAAIDANAVPETAPMKPDSFAAECVLNGLLVGVNAHYLMAAAAQLKSGLKADKQGDEVGPYRMREGEWGDVRGTAAFEMEISRPTRSPTGAPRASALPCWHTPRWRPDKRADAAADGGRALRRAADRRQGRRGCDRQGQGNGR